MNSIFHSLFSVELWGNLLFFLCMCIAGVTSWPPACRQSRNSVISLDLFGKKFDHRLIFMRWLICWMMSACHESSHMSRLPCSSMALEVEGVVRSVLETMLLEQVWNWLTQGIQRAEIQNLTCGLFRTAAVPCKREVRMTTTATGV